MPSMVQNLEESGIMFGIKTWLLAVGSAYLHVTSRSPEMSVLSQLAT